jgi:hypothetical protein
MTPREQLILLGVIRPTNGAPAHHGGPSAERERNVPTLKLDAAGIKAAKRAIERGEHDGVPLVLPTPAAS